MTWVRGSRGRWRGCKRKGGHRRWARGGAHGVRVRLVTMRGWGGVSNVPTVLTNVLVGSAVAVGGGAVPWGVVAVVMVAGVLFYVGGMALNDAVGWRQRPRGGVGSTDRVGAGVCGCGVRVGGGGVLLGGVAVLGFCGVWSVGVGLGLVGAIVGYNGVHKRYAGSALLMGLCRGLVYGLAWVAVWEAGGGGWGSAGRVGGAIVARGGDDDLHDGVDGDRAAGGPPVGGGGRVGGGG